MSVATLLETLDLEETVDGTYRTRNFDTGERGFTFGGQLLAQFIVASARTEQDKRVKSAHAVFARPVLVEQEAEISIDTLQSGRSFASVSASLSQGGKECSRALVLLTSEEPDLIRHAAEMPDVPTPEDLESEPSGANWATSENVRIIGDVDILDPDCIGDPGMQVWMRWPDAGEDPAVAQGLLTHGSAGFLIGCALRPHPGVGQSAAHVEFSTGIIAHSVSFHELFDARDWLLYSQRSTYSGRGRAYGIGEVFTRTGQLVAGFSQESMIRHFPEGVSSAGRENTVL